MEANDLDDLAENLRAEDIRQLLALLPSIFETMEWFLDTLKSLSLPPALFSSWAHYYDRPFIELANVAFFAATAPLSPPEQKQLKQTIINAPNSLSAVSAAQSKIVEILAQKNFDDLSDGETQAIVVDALAMILPIVAIFRSVQALMFVGRSINDLMAEARQGNDKALFTAIRIDSMAMGCQTVQDRVALATIKSDSTFFNKLKLAQNGPLTQWLDKDFMEMRLVLEILHEYGVHQMTDEQLEYVFSKKLRLYFYNKGEGGKAKALRKFFKEYMKPENYYQNQTEPKV